MTTRQAADRHPSLAKSDGNPPSGELDGYDMKILNALVGDGRMSWRDLSERIGLSLTPTLRRVRRLEAAGYIEGYTAILDEQRLIGSLSAFVSVTLEKQSDETLGTFETQVAMLDEVTSCFMMTGSFDYLVRVVVRDLTHYQGLVTKLARIPNVAHINSSFVLKAVVRKPGLPI